MVNNDDVLQLLTQMEQLLVRSDLGSNVKPDPAAFMSQEPFFIDTMSSTEWLQWVFIPKMRQLISDRQPLPTRCALAPYFEETLTEENASLLSLLQQLDALLNQESE